MLFVVATSVRVNEQIVVSLVLNCPEHFLFHHWLRNEETKLSGQEGHSALAWFPGGHHLCGEEANCFLPGGRVVLSMLAQVCLYHTEFGHKGLSEGHGLFYLICVATPEVSVNVP